jgi:hypothetical protein
LAIKTSALQKFGAPAREFSRDYKIDQPAEPGWQHETTD